jgi:predicted transcriptional regulator
MAGKTKSTIMIDSDLWKRLRMIAILNEMEISELVEEALREKLGRMKQLEQYSEYKDVEGLRVQSGGQSQQTQNNDKVIHSARYEKAKSNGPITTQQSFDKDNITPTLGRGEGEITIPMPGLKFPTDKEKLIEYRKIRNVRSTLFFIENIPEGKTYENVFQLQEDFKNAINNTPELKERFKKIGSRGFVECMIDTSETPTRRTDQQQQGRELYELKDEKWTVMDEHRRMLVLRKFIGKIANENKINGIEACKLIMKQKELLKRAADEIGTEDEARLYYWFKNEVDVRAQIKEMKEIREREERQQQQKERKGSTPKSKR